MGEPSSSLRHSSSHDSLFSSASDEDDEAARRNVASVTAPAIPGLFFLPEVLPPATEQRLLAQLDAFYPLDQSTTDCANQFMLFGRAREMDDASVMSGLPGWADELVCELEPLLERRLDEQTMALLYPLRAPASQAHRSRQLIVNHYLPSQGITPHIDLPTRFGDGILVCSLRSDIAMDFRRGQGEQQHTLWLPRRSVVVLSGEVRWEWEHGIAAREGDWVHIRSDGDEGPVWVARRTRTSVTIRWLLPGADVVGGGSSCGAEEDDDGDAIA